MVSNSVLACFCFTWTYTNMPSRSFAFNYYCWLCVRCRSIYTCIHNTQQYFVYDIILLYTRHRYKQQSLLLTFRLSPVRVLLCLFVHVVPLFVLCLFASFSSSFFFYVRWPFFFLRCFAADLSTFGSHANRIRHAWGRRTKVTSCSHCCVLDGFRLKYMHNTRERRSPAPALRCKTIARRMHHGGSGTRYSSTTVFTSNTAACRDRGTRRSYIALHTLPPFVNCLKQYTHVSVSPRLEYEVLLLYMVGSNGWVSSLTSPHVYLCTRSVLHDPPPPTPPDTKESTIPTGRCNIHIFWLFFVDRYLLMLLCHLGCTTYSAGGSRPGEERKEHSHQERFRCQPWGKWVDNGQFMRVLKDTI